MIVVSDPSPINYLVEIDCIHVLEILFEHVVGPDAVFTEVCSPGARRRLNFGFHTCRIG